MSYLARSCSHERSRPPNWLGTNRHVIVAAIHGSQDSRQGQRRRSDHPPSPISLERSDATGSPRSAVRPSPQTLPEEVQPPPRRWLRGRPEDTTGLREGHHQSHRLATTQRLSIELLCSAVAGCDHIPTTGRVPGDEFAVDRDRALDGTSVLRVLEADVEELARRGAKVHAFGRSYRSRGVSGGRVSSVESRSEMLRSFRRIQPSIRRCRRPAV